MKALSLLCVGAFVYLLAVHALPTLARPGEDLPVPPPSEWRLTASGGEEDSGFAPDRAADGDMATRWSSAFTDHEWLAIDLGRVATVTGLTIHWETAYGKSFEIAASIDGAEWRTVYATKRGDGGRDDLYFGPVNARYLKLVGRERGTGWGYSIFELSVKGPDEQVDVRSQPAGGEASTALFDGDVATIWQAPAAGAVTLTLDFQKQRPMAGLRIDWGAVHARRIDLCASNDGVSWQRVDAPPFGAAEYEMLLHDRIDARHLRLELADASADAPIEIRELSLVDVDAGRSRLNVLRVAAELMPPGVYPEHLRRRQVYWTVVGLPVDTQESLLDEYGNLECRQDGTTLMPYIWLDGQLGTPVAADAVAQTLAEGRLPLPGVTWQSGPVEVAVTALTRGLPSASMTYARYRVRNTSDASVAGRLLLAVRPTQVNPPWQYGGLSPIHDIAIERWGERAATTVAINGQATWFAMPPADAVGVRGFDRGDVGQDLLAGRVPAGVQVHDDAGLASGVLAYDFALAPGAARAVVVATPLHGVSGDLLAFGGAGVDPASAFDAAWAQQLDYWRARLAGPVIALPDRDVIDMWWAQIAYILINQDGYAIQPGSRNYNRTWMRDGGSSMAVLLRAGLFEDARRWLGWYAARVRLDGLVPPILTNTGELYTGWGSNIEWDSQGEFLHALAEYHRFTGDAEFVQAHHGHIDAVLAYTRGLIERTSAADYLADAPAPERFRGVLPPSISHEGYDPPVHSYWDDFWALKGLKDARALAESMGWAATRSEADALYTRLRTAVGRSIAATIAHFGIDYIPGCAEKGDFDATSTAIGIAPCGEMELLDRGLLENTFHRYYVDLMKRREPGWNGQFTPYELRSIPALVALGQPSQANDLLDYMLTCRRPPAWNHLGEVVHANPRFGGYIGDLPHTWVGAEYVYAVRSMLAQESGESLHVLAGVLPRWLTGAGVRVRNLPTYFGLMSFSAALVDDVLTVDFEAAGSGLAGSYVVHVPAGFVARSADADGVALAVGDAGAVTAPGGARRVVVHLERDR